MRHSLAIQWLNEGFTLNEGSAVLGHSNIRSAIVDMPNKPLKNSAISLRRRGLIVNLLYSQVVNPLKLKREILEAKGFESGLSETNVIYSNGYKRRKFQFTVSSRDKHAELGRPIPNGQGGGSEDIEPENMRTVIKCSLEYGNYI